MLQRKTERRLKWFESYISAVLQKDIRELSKIEGLMHIAHILCLIAATVGDTTNLPDIGRISVVKNTTVKKYMALPEQIFLVLKIPARTSNTEGQFVKPPGIFLNDTSFLCQLRGEADDSLMANRISAGSYLKTRRQSVRL